ncbi:putative leucine-rich repeat receptor-like protein kinase [Prunus yedoensis var. nudiflora]|uniref:Putative leucine-rich repeat receptor-like protein kinase n=1 Tax=Prunus yedoensis var. nudiflora TaxID=2094558 RepID=A0A314ZI31_PRUYE|nr:putative leucine-rich repeat receptor-like protein kinase [Prunus yedoensis var. nudiflora]
MDPFGRHSSWVGEDCCKWSGVGCNNITGRVNRLDLHNRDWFDYYGATEHGFDGEIKPSLLVLKDLEYLDLSLNLFGGVQFPSFIGSLEKLKYPNLSRTYLVGVIPPNLGNLSRLLYLDLKSFRTLETDLQWLATLSSLKYLNLGGVNLTKTTSYWLPAVNMLPSLVEFDDHSVGCTDIERKALLKLKQGLTDPSGRHSSWVGEDCCKWSGAGYNNITYSN